MRLPVEAGKDAVNRGGIVTVQSRPCPLEARAKIGPGCGIALGGYTRLIRRGHVGSRRIGRCRRRAS
jgi:hypothetical protein